MRWLSKWFRTFRLPNATTTRRKSTRRLVLEQLESRTLLATINWTNRGSPTNDSDGFNAVFGANAEIARNDVQAAIFYWQRVIADFQNQPTVIEVNTMNVDISMSSTNRIGAGEFGGLTLFGVDGKPYSGKIEIDRGNDGRGSGWYLDPTPYDSAEFRGTILNAFAGMATPGSGVESKYDLVTFAVAELAHALGFN